jgi:hypothetical protein
MDGSVSQLDVICARESSSVFTRADDRFYLLRRNAVAQTLCRNVVPHYERWRIDERGGFD